MGNMQNFEYPLHSFELEKQYFRKLIIALNLYQNVISTLLHHLDIVIENLKVHLSRFKQRIRFRYFQDALFYLFFSLIIEEVIC